MMIERDFTLKKAIKLFEALPESGYVTAKFCDFINGKCAKNDKVVIVRHDVDRMPKSALDMAKLERKLNIFATYYFRFKRNTFCKGIITQISKMGHEVGYHYEVLSKTNGNVDLAINLFCKELEEIRKIVRVDTICAHGSPFSRWDNKKIWQNIDYNFFGIKGDPFFDLDFNKILYLTDTGRRWDGGRFIVRDKVQSNFNKNFKTTEEIIKSLEGSVLPNLIMLNMHPNRWSDNPILWIYEFIGQKIKNLFKSLLYKFN